MVTGVNRIGPSIRSGPAFCPRLSNGTEILNGNEILVSSGHRKSISVKVDHIAQFIIQSRLQDMIIGYFTTSIDYVSSNTQVCLPVQHRGQCDERECRAVGRHHPLRRGGVHVRFRDADDHCLFLRHLGPVEAP